MLDKEEYKKRLLEEVEFLADREHQQKAWVDRTLYRGACIPIETYIHFFDGLDVESEVPILLESNKPLLEKFELLFQLYHSAAKRTGILSYDFTALDSYKWKRVIEQAQLIVEHIQKQGWERKPKPHRRRHH